MPSRLLKREGILTIVLGLAALGAASYFLLFAPELRVIRSLRAEIAAKDTEVADTLKMRAAVSEARAGEGSRWEERLRSWERRVPAAPDTERLLAEIGELAVRHNLKVFGLKVAPAGAAPEGGAPQEPSPAASEPGREVTSGPVETRFTITFHSTYRDLAEFLDDIPRARRLLTIRSVSVKEKTDAMAAEIELSAWHREGR